MDIRFPLEKIAESCAMDLRSSGSVTPSERIPNPGITGDGTPWSSGGAVSFGGGQIIWFEPEIAMTPLTSSITNALAFTCNIALTNVSAQMRVSLFNSSTLASQIIYATAVPVTGTVNIPGVSTGVFDQLRIQTFGAGATTLVVTNVSLVA